MKILPLALFAASVLVGCGVLRGGEDAQGIVNARVVGMPVGDFITRYGPPKVREEGRDGISFDWVADFAYVGPGPRGTEEDVCRLRISADRSGKIVSATILRDGAGKRHVSRCADVFDPG